MRVRKQFDRPLLRERIRFFIGNLFTRSFSCRRCSNKIYGEDCFYKKHRTRRFCEGFWIEGVDR